MEYSHAPKVGVLHASYFIEVFIALSVLVVHAQGTSAGQRNAAWATSSSQNMSFTTPVFLAADTYGSGGIWAWSVAVADVNGDGKLDLVVGNDCAENASCYHNASVGVLLGNGDGTFQTAVPYWSGGGEAMSVVVADVNADGRPDVLVANYYGSGAYLFEGEVGVLLGNGDGSFQPVATYPAGPYEALSLAVADLNGDHKPDLVLTNKSGAVGVLLGNGDGTFQTEVYVGYWSGDGGVAAADVNGDGKLDLLVTSWTTSTVAVLLGNGDATFQQAKIYPSGGESPSSITVEDVNNDSNQDLLIVNRCASGISSVDCNGNIPADQGGVAVLIGNGDGTFQAPVAYGCGGKQPNYLTVADVNGDGRLDLAVSSFCGIGADCWNDSNHGIVGILLGNGIGSFGPALMYSSGGPRANWVAARDVDGNGKPDLLVANACGLRCDSGAVGVLLNDTPSCTTPPVVTVSASPAALWPANGKLVPVTVSGKITDGDNGCVVNTAVYAVKDEYGKIQPSGEVTLGAGGAYSFAVWLQASRLGTDLDGRLYTVTVAASGNGGKTVSNSGSVIVPHDQGQ